MKKKILSLISLLILTLLLSCSLDSTESRSAIYKTQNVYFEVVGNNFMTYHSNETYTTNYVDGEISNVNYSAILLQKKSNPITSFDLHTNNTESTAITTYNDKFYIVDNVAQAVYIYDNGGVYETNLTLTHDSNFVLGITFYNDKFYVSDAAHNPPKVFIYDTNGIHDSDFDLDSDNKAPSGLTLYNNKFYVVDVKKVHFYNTSGDVQGTFNLAKNNNQSSDITVYDDELYICDADDSSIYIYSTKNGIKYRTSFRLSSDNNNPFGVEVYDNKFYVTDFNDLKVYIYPFN